MGSMHTGLEDHAKHFPRLAAYFAERARGGVGLIVTGGFAPNIEGWTSPFGGRLTTRAAAARHRPITDAVHAEGGAHRAADPAHRPLRLPPARRRAVAHQVADHAVHAARALGARHRAPDPRLRALRRARPRGGLRRRRGDGLRGLLHQPVPRGAHQPAHRRLGRQLREPHAAAGRDRRAHARGGRAATSSSSTACRCSTWCPTAAAGTRSCSSRKAIERAGATIINTGIGWHEARVPTIATSVPRAAFAWVTKKLKGEVGIPLCTTNRINTPEVAEQVLADGCADMVSMARPLLADPEFVEQGRGRPRRRDQHLHRLQPGLPRPRLPAPASRRAS